MIFLICVLLFDSGHLVALTTQEEAPVMFHAKVDGVRMRYEITQSQLDRYVKWEASDVNPPIAIRDAIDISKLAIEDFAKKGFVKKEKEWAVRLISIVPIGGDKWYYVVEYGQRNAFGNPPAVTIVILMDGIWLQPLPTSD